MLKHTLGLALFITMIFDTAVAKDFYRFTGGPTGGSFQLYASLSVSLSEEISGLKVSPQASAGSISTENLRRGTQVGLTSELSIPETYI